MVKLNMHCRGISNREDEIFGEANDARPYTLKFESEDQRVFVRVDLATAQRFTVGRSYVVTVEEG